MLIVTYELLAESADDSALCKELQGASAIQVAECCWILPGTKSATDWTNKLADLIDEDRDRLMVAVVDSFAEIGWVNAICGDPALGNAIRNERENTD